MALTPGTRLGVYEITALIGEGGMGQVYRATDTTLGRQVAIKILPDAFAADPERMARFEREAKTLASPNHPNIAAIYGFEKSAGLRALVMELVEGPTLADVIAAGVTERARWPQASAPSVGEAPHGISIDEALPIAKQIVDALEAAHEQGIIHRDLKPANIKLKVRGVPPPRTEDGRLERKLSAADVADCTVKVLDFGLAKAMEPTGVLAASNSMSPTITTPAMTQAGMILGTAAYMSPEQAKGRTVDRRTDIWAFGCVLYEMLTSTRAFTGDDIADTLANVLKTEPDWNRLPAEVSPRVRLTLRACLQKDPKQRMGDVQSVRLALEGAFETAAPQATASATSSAPRGRLAWMVATVAVLAAIVLAIPAVRYLRETAPPALPETRLEISTPATDRPTDFALSPDGRQIVFVASGDGTSRLWLRSLATTTAQPLAGTEGATYPFWSPDGRSMGFFTVTALKRIDLGSGAPQTLAPVNNGRGGTWNADGVIVFASTGPVGLMRVSATGGAATAVTTLGLPQERGHVAPSFLPDSRRFLFYVRADPDTAGIYLGSLDGSAPIRLTAADSAGVSLPAGPRPTEASREGGWLLWVRAGTLVAQRLDTAQAALTGEPVTLADGVAVDNGLQSAVSVAATGLVAYRTGAGSQRQLTWVDRSGTARGTVGDPDATLQEPRVSPDGRRVAVRRTVQGNQDLWLLDGARASRFTFEAAPDQFPVWSPDGTRIAFRSTRAGVAGDLYQNLTSGVGVDERLVASDQEKNPTSWSADGRFLLYHSNDPQSYGDLWVVPMVGNHTPSVVLKTPFREAFGAFSPDGRWVAYQSNESGRPEICVRPFVPPSRDASADRPGGQWPVSTAGGIMPVWRPDGKELYYLNPAGAMMAAPIIVTGTTLAPGAPVLLFPTRIVGGGADVQVGRNYDVAPDGRFLINTELDSAAAPITLLMNWHPEGKK